MPLKPTRFYIITEPRDGTTSAPNAPGFTLQQVVAKDIPEDIVMADIPEWIAGEVKAYSLTQPHAKLHVVTNTQGRTWTPKVTLEEEAETP